MPWRARQFKTIDCKDDPLITDIPPITKIYGGRLRRAPVVLQPGSFIFMGIALHRGKLN
jgi:hypothetical protein